MILKNISLFSTLLQKNVKSGMNLSLEFAYTICLILNVFLGFYDIYVNSLPWGVGSGHNTHTIVSVGVLSTNTPRGRELMYLT